MPPQLSPKRAADTKVDGLTFQFHKKQNIKVAIQADVTWDLRAASASGTKVVYYEVQLVDLDGKSNVAIGIAASNFPIVDVIPGRITGSYSYQGEDKGQLLSEGGPPAQYGGGFGKGDIVGVGIDTSSGELFFTKNGAPLGIATTVDTSKEYFPTVGAATKCTLKFNLEGPFACKNFQAKPGAVGGAQANKGKAPESPKPSPVKEAPKPSPVKEAPLKASKEVPKEPQQAVTPSSVKEEKKAETQVPPSSENKENQETKETKETKESEGKENKENKESQASSSKPVVAPIQTTPPPAAPEKTGAKGHIMISYQWGCKEFALSIYNALTAKGFVVWMDVKGGMSGDIYQSMAEGVEGAVVFVPLLTAKYAASPNCRRECTAAADKRKKIVPLKCDNMEFTGWLSVIIPGLLWTQAYDDKTNETKITDSNMEFFLSEVDKAIPADSPARKPNLSIYISYSPKDKEHAGIIRKLLEERKPPFNCVMSAEEKSSSVSTPRSGGGGEGEGKKDGVMQKSAALEEKLTNAKAVILIVSQNFETTNDCKNDISLSYSHRKFIIPILVQRLKSGYPPKEMEFALKDVPFLDCVNLIHSASKHSTISRKITEALTAGAVTKAAATTESNENFLIKNVGKWTESDVSQWLNSSGLSQYVSVFKQKHVNGRVLLGLQEKDLDSLQVMKLHQRRFSSAISTLFNGLNWNEDEVAEWMESVGLSELTPNLYKAHINGQSLLMLTESDLTANEISDPVTQKRILAEIQHLKETEAKVPRKDDLYRFKHLRAVLKPVPSDAKDDNFKFGKETLELLRHIYRVVEEDQKDTKLAGLTQVSLKKFLFTLLICAGIYHDTYPTKNIWNDINVVEFLSLKNLADEFVTSLDDLVSSFDTISQLKEGSPETEGLADTLKSNKMFAILCYNYLILNNIVTRLFAVFDRGVDGVVSWNELLPGLELLVHGSNNDKFLLALGLVDFNGDGDISKEEYDGFYKDCFLPVVSFCKVIKMADFDTLNKGSFLYVAYQKVKDNMSAVRAPLLLNKNFSVRQYKGFVMDRQEDYDFMFNVPWEQNPCVWCPYGFHPHPLVQTERPPKYGCNACIKYIEHTTESYYCAACDFDVCPDCYPKCSTDAPRNIDILGAYTNGPEFTLTNITFGGKFNLSSQLLVKNALLWVTMEKPELHAYEKFNNYTKEQVEQYTGDDTPLFISADPADNFMAKIDLGEAKKVGKYVLIKLLEPFTEEEIKAGEEAAVKKAEERAKAEAEKRAEEEKKAAEAEKEKEGEDGETKEPAGKEKEEEKEETNADEEEEEDNETGGGEDGEGAEGGHEETSASIPDDKKLAVEFIGLWGFDGKITATDTQQPGEQLFAALEAKYKAIGPLKPKKDSSAKINKYVSEFLNAAIDMYDSNEELSPSAAVAGVHKADVLELLARLNYLASNGENPAFILSLIQPILHLFRLFYGYSVPDILLKPM